MTSPLRLRSIAALLAVSTLATLGCGKREGSWPAAAVAPVARMFDGKPLPRLDPATLMRPSPIRSWDLADPADRKAWRHRGGDGVTATAAGYALEPRTRAPGTQVRFTTRVQIAAEEIDAVLVAFAGDKSPVLRLSWAAPREACRREGVQLPSRSAKNGPIVIRFPVAGDPAWQGEINRICLAIRSNSTPVELQRVALVQEHFDAGESEDHRFRARLATETRPAFVGVVGRPATWPLEISNDSRLEFGFGTTARGSGRVRVVAATSRGDETLFSADLGTDAEHPPDAWHGARVDLKRWAGESVTLRFETESAKSADRGLILWSEPLVLGPAPTADRPNLVLLSLDTLRPDHLSLYGYERSTSPRIDRWAEDGVVFDHAVTSAPWTLPAHLSLMTGLDALHHGINHSATVPQEFALLAARLRALGYQTFAVTGGGYLHAETGFDRGFDRYRSWADRKASDGEIRSTIAGALEWIEEVSDRPFFLFIHTYEIHHPFRFREPFFSDFYGGPPPPKTALSYIANTKRATSATLLTKWPAVKRGAGAERLDEESFPMFVAAYDSGIAYADQELSRLFDRLDRPELAARTATILISDHGEALGEKGYASHMYLEDFVARIPLVLRLPGSLSGGQRIDRQVRIVDVYPTLLDLVGGAEDADAIDGRSLLPLIRGEQTSDAPPAWIYAGFSRRGLGLRLDNRWKYMLNNSATAQLLGSENLYDLQTDPSETHDLAADHPRVAEFRRRALRHIAEKGSGLRLRLQNPAPTPLVFTFSGPDLQLTRVKSGTLNPERLEWVSRSELTVTLEPGEETILFMENPGRRRQGVRIETPTDPPFHLPLATVEPPARVAWQRGTFQLTSRDDRADSAVLDVDWRGLRGATELGGDQTEIGEQLKALGYLN